MEALAIAIIVVVVLVIIYLIVQNVKKNDESEKLTQT
jgi:uncharacterized membrane protein